MMCTYVRMYVCYRRRDGKHIRATNIGSPLLHTQKGKYVRMSEMIWFDFFAESQRLFLLEMADMQLQRRKSGEGRNRKTTGTKEEEEGQRREDRRRERVIERKKERGHFILSERKREDISF